MIKRIKSATRSAKPTPAMGVAFLALLVALGGTASALKGKNSVDSADLKKNVVTSAKIKNNDVKGDDVLESSLGEVPSATAADNGYKGYAQVTAAGNVDPTGPTLNITSGNVTNPTDGVYCFNGLPFTPLAMSANGDAISGIAIDNFFVVSLAPENNTACAGNEQAAVESRDDEDDGASLLQDTDFYVVFH